MKRILLILGLISLTIHVSGNEENSCKVIIYRESNASGGALSYKISANDSLLIRIRNNSYFVYDCAPGSYTFMVEGYEDTKVNLTAEAGKTYYLRFGLRTGFWAAIPELLLVESISAEGVIESGQLRQLHDYDEQLPRPRNRIGLALSMGGGFQTIPMVVLENGNNADFSFGGGVGFGLSYGYEISNLLDLSFEFYYRSTGLTPKVSNASIDFTSWVTRITPALIIPIDGGYSMRLKLGAGINYNSSNKLDINTRRLQGGTTDNWFYGNSLGAHGALTFELSPSENWTLSYGVFLYNSGFDYSHSQRTSYPLDSKLINGNGSGIDLSMKVFYNF